jgi:hypothetical protein
MLRVRSVLSLFRLGYQLEPEADKLRSRIAIRVETLSEFAL